MHVCFIQNFFQLLLYLLETAANGSIHFIAIGKERSKIMGLQLTKVIQVLTVIGLILTLLCATILEHRIVKSFKGENLQVHLAQPALTTVQKGKLRPLMLNDPCGPLPSFSPNPWCLMGSHPSNVSQHIFFPEVCITCTPFVLSQYSIFS